MERYVAHVLLASHQVRLADSAARAAMGQMGFKLALLSCIEPLKTAGSDKRRWRSSQDRPKTLADTAGSAKRARRPFRFVRQCRPRPSLLFGRPVRGLTLTTT